MREYLEHGETGDDVRNLQGLLNFHLNGTGTVKLPLTGYFGDQTSAAVIRFQKLNRLWADGVVGPKTRAALLDAREGRMWVEIAPSNGSRSSAAGLTPVRVKAATQSRFHRPTSFRPAAFQLTAGQVTQPAPPQVSAQSVVIQVGQQANFKPWFISPTVIGGQWNILIQNNGKVPFQISPNVQLFQNQIGSSAGRWSGQGSVQLGPTGIFKIGNFDLLNPFVSVFVQRNQGQPAGPGFAIGTQANWNLLGDKLSLFINLQEVFSVDGGNGKGNLPSGQIFTGAAVDVFQLFFKN